MATFSNQTKNSTSFTNGVINLERSALLIEAPYYLSIGDSYLLSIDPNRGTSFGNQTKTASTFANQTKN